jgi:hypothetical protein
MQSNPSLERTSAGMARRRISLLLGCSSHPLAGYGSFYEVGGSRKVDGQTAEQLYAAAVTSSQAASGVHHFDKPLAILRAPQPRMSPEDTDQRVVGRVVIEVVFNEAGLVETSGVIENRLLRCLPSLRCKPTLYAT